MNPLCNRDLQTVIHATIESLPARLRVIHHSQRQGGFMNPLCIRDLLPVVHPATSMWLYESTLYSQPATSYPPYDCEPI